MSNRRRGRGEFPRLGRQDPRELSGPGIAGPGGPRDFGAVLVAAGSAVLMDSVDVCEVDARRRQSGEQLTVFAASLGGKVNHSPDLVRVTFLFGADGAASLVSELFAVACRSGMRLEFEELLRQRLAQLGADGNLDDVTGGRPA